MPGRLPHVVAALLRRLLATLALVVVLGAAATPALHAASVAAPNSDGGAAAGSWAPDGWQILESEDADQGVATVAVPGHRAFVLTRGSSSISPELLRQGWVHIGDPDSYRGSVLDAYQGRPGARSKLFVLTSPSGRRAEFVHPLTPGERYNNSFVAIAPGGQWFVSGEWGTVNRLLVFATPHRSAGGTLPLATILTLRSPMSDVQGCAFASSTTLLCSTNDPEDDRYGLSRQLLAVRLEHPLQGRAVTATVSVLGAVPRIAGCFGSGETEGIDIHGSRMLLAVVSPCDGSTNLYVYDRATTTRSVVD